MTQTRAERRRGKHAAQKGEQYAKSGFRDRATYAPFTPHERTGSRHNGGYTESELHQRAVERRDAKRMIEKMVREQIEASKEATKARRAERKAARQAAIDWHKPQPVHHMHSAARRRLAADSSLPLAA